MRTKTIITASLLLLFMNCGHSQQKGSHATAAKVIATGVTVIELFTSEGCSSCPSADALMPKLKKEYGDKLIVLSFHVDYWDRLGWKDAFSNPEYTRRQNEYAAALGAENIYTPQAVVNGRAHVTGSNASTLRELIDESKDAKQAAPIISARIEHPNKVTVSYKAQRSENEVINIALVQRIAVTNVRRGENEGRHLQHYNVVVGFKTLDAENGNVVFPVNHSTTEYDVIAFVQQKGDMHITSATEVAVE